MTAQFHTEWSGPIKLAKPSTDRERHELFSRHVRAVADEAMPWLFPLLDATNAKILAAPGLFCYSIDPEQKVWLDAPEMIQRLHMVPWATDEEAIQ